MNNYEILAPVGSKESFYAAIATGANAVYMGGKLFNARHYASNFEIDEIKELVTYAHLRNVKIYITMNTLLKDIELKDTVSYIKDLYQVGVDALIIQDLGLYKIIKLLCPNFEIHASTQMSIHNADGARLCKQLGFERVVLARETNIGEIKEIVKENIELEVFIHGALCQSYSGQCLMSSMLGGRSGNRGRCAQPCRLPYEIVSIDNNNFQSEKKFYLSPKDLCTIDDVDELVKAGVYSLKIEGRMKRPEYVATVVNNYKSKLADTKGIKIDKIKEELMQIFNRGFTNGFLFGSGGKEYLSLDQPNNKGIEIGKVISSKKKNTYILEVSVELEIGDGIEFRLNDNSCGLQLNKFKKIKDKVYELEYSKNINKYIIYRTSQKKLLDKAQELSKKDDIKYPLHLNIYLEKDKPLKLVAEDINLGYKVEVQGNQITELAQKNGLDKERIFKTLNKLGDTVFYYSDVVYNLDDNLYLPVKEINKCRRLLIEKLESNRTDLKRENKIFEEETFKLLKLEKEKELSSEFSLNAYYRKLDQISEKHFNYLNRIYLPLSELNEEFLEKYSKKIEIYGVLNRILDNNEMLISKKNIRKYDKYLAGIVATNLSHIELLKDYTGAIHGGEGLNIFNSIAGMKLNEMGLSSMTVSPELNLNEVSAMKKINNSKYELIGYGNLALMIMKNCPFSAITNCNKKCGLCKYSSKYGLKDRKNKIFPIYKDGFKNSVLYNSQKLIITDQMNKIKKSGINQIRLDFINESQIEIEEVLKYYKENINANKTIEKPKFIQNLIDNQEYTRGHMQRGVE